MGKKVLLLVSSAKSLINFRFNLMKDLVGSGCSVIACAPADDKIGKVIDKLKEINVRFVSLRIKNTNLNFLYDLTSMVSIFKILKSEQPDVLLNYMIKPVIYGSIIGRFAGVKNIYSTITGLGYVFIGNSLKQRLLRFVAIRLYVFALQFNQKVFFQNQDDLDLFIGKGIINNGKGLLINGSGVDIKHYASVFFPDECVFLLVARLLKDKGIYEYVEAARQIKKKYPDVIFRLLGGYSENPSAIRKSEIDNWCSEGFIEYLGELEDVRPALRESSIFVLPSYREGLPRSVLEAMATGRPIITTDAPGCRETVIDNFNGYLVPARNVKKLIESMEKFILYPEKIKNMGQESRAIVEVKYDVSEVNKVIIGSLSL